MKLSKRGRYALRALVYLSLNSDKEKMTLSKIAKENDISTKYLAVSYTHLDVYKRQVLVIGGGTAGCYAAITLGQKKDVNVLIVEKANIKRSGCLAAGVNAINAYITEGHVPQDYVDYAKKDADGIAVSYTHLDVYKRQSLHMAEKKR